MSTGKFDYHRNCSLIHHIPADEVLDGMPVIVIPRNPGQVIAGKIYDYLPTATRDATYIIDGTRYRVVHADHMTPTDNSHANPIDSIKHGRTACPPSTLGDKLDPGTREKLLALKNRRI